MIRAVTIDLLKEVPHGVFEQNSPVVHTVFAEIRSVSMKEFYLAANDGIEPELIFRLTDYSDYNGEKLVRYDGDEWDVIRTYTPVDGQVIDITCKRKEKNA